MSDDNHAAGYDFVKLGEGLASALLRAAQEQVERAQHVLDQTKSLADILRTQVAAQAQQIEEMNGRFKQFGVQMLEAHRVLNGDESEPWTGATLTADLPPFLTGGVGTARRDEPPTHEDMKTKLRVLPPRPQ